RGRRVGTTTGCMATRRTPRSELAPCRAGLLSGCRPGRTHLGSTMNRQQRTTIVLVVSFIAALMASYGVYTAPTRIPVLEPQAPQTPTLYTPPLAPATAPHFRAPPNPAVKGPASRDHHFITISNGQITVTPAPNPGGAWVWLVIPIGLGAGYAVARYR